VGLSWWRGVGAGYVGFLVFMVAIVVMNRRLAHELTDPDMRRASEVTGDPMFMLRHPIRSTKIVNSSLGRIRRKNARRSTNDGQEADSEVGQEGRTDRRSPREAGTQP
jgi:hypothetical protein